MSNTKDLRNFVEKWVEQELWHQYAPHRIENFIEIIMKVAKEPELIKLIPGRVGEGEFQQELEEFGVDSLKAMREEIKNSSSNDHERLYAISAAFQRVISVFPRQGV